MIISAPQLDSNELKSLDFIGQQRVELLPVLASSEPWLPHLRRTAFVNQVVASLSLEGAHIPTSAAQEMALTGHFGDASVPEFGGFFGAQMALDFAIQTAHDSTFLVDRNLLKSLHFMVASGSHELAPGALRVGPIFVRSAHPSRVINTGAEWEQVPNLVTEICDSANDFGSQNGLISAAMAHLNLSLVHPFKGQNGVLARTVHAMLLERENRGSWWGIAQYLASNSRDYQSVLAQIGGGSWNPMSNARPWLRMVLSAHMHANEHLRVEIASLRAIWNEISAVVTGFGLNNRVVGALVHVESENSLNNQVYRAILSESGVPVSQLTASRDLAELVVAGLLSPYGNKRARFYGAGPELLSVTARLAGKFRNQPVPKFF